MRRSVLLVATLVALATVPLPAAAQSTVDLRYTVTLVDRDTGTYRIEARFSDLDYDSPSKPPSKISKFHFQVGTYASKHDCENLVIAGTPRPCTRSACGDGVCTVEVDDDQDTLTYRLDTELALQGSQGGYNAVTTQDWAVLQASGIGLQYSYTFFESDPPSFDPTMQLSLPDGWEAEASFPKSGDTFLLEPRFPRPAGVLVLGDFDATEFEVAGRDAVLAEVAPSRSADVARLVRDTTPFLRSTFGDHVGPKLLFVVAPDPFKSGGVAARDGFVVHDGSSPQTVVHEWVHIWQRFEVCSVPQGSDCFASSDRTDTSGTTVWLKEGGAEYHSALALHASGHWSVSRVQEFFDDLRERRYEEGVLAESNYQQSTDTAYTKGALTLARLDEGMRDATNRTVDLSSAFSDLNADKQDADVLVETNADFEDRLEWLTSHGWSAFFDAYVQGDDDPGPYSFAPRGAFKVREVSVQPARPIAGRNVTFRANVTNTGTVEATETVRIFVDGQAIHNATVTLDVGDETTVEHETTAPPPGEIRVESGGVARTVRVLAPARLAVGSVETEPVEPAADEPFAALVHVTNEGDVRGSGPVTLEIDGRAPLQEDASVPGGSESTVRFDGIRLPAGRTNATVEIGGDGRGPPVQVSWHVSARSVLPRGIPTIPATGVGALVAAAAVAGWLRRNR